MEAEKEAARQQANMNDLIQRDVRRQAATFAATQFPDATPEQALMIAKDAEKKLLSTSGPTRMGLTAEETARQQRESLRDFSATLPAGAAVAGATLGGPPGAVVGAGLGAVAESGINALTGKDVDVFRNIRNKMAGEAIGLEVFDKTFGAVARMFRGNKEVADEISTAFIEVGMRPALQDVSTFPLTEGARNVLGSLPLLNRPFKARATRTAQEFQSTLDEYIESVSPDTVLLKRMVDRGDVEGAARLQEQLAEGVFDGVAAGYESLRALRDQRFARLRAIESQLEARAEDAGVSMAVPSRNTRGRIAQVAGLIDDIQVQVRNGVIDEPDQLGRTIQFIQKLSGDQLGRNMTFSQLRRLKGRVSREIATVTDDPTSVEFLTRVKEGVEEDLVQAASRHPDLQAAYDDAMQVSEEFLTILGGVATKRGQQINRGLGRRAIQEVTTETGETIQKGAGSRDVSTLVDTLASSANPNEIRQFFGVLERGVGQQEAQNMIRLSLGRKIQKAAEAAFRESAEKAGDPTYKPGVLLRQLGLDTPNSKQFNATAALFEAAGMDTRRMMATSRVLDALFSVKNPRVSQYLQRRATIGGGMQSLLRGVSGGMIGGATAASGGPGIIPAVAMYTLGRSYAKWVTSPARARLITTVADIRLPENRRALAMVSMLSDPIWWQGESPEETQQLEILRAQVKDQLATKAGQEKFIRDLDREIRFK